MTATPGQGSVTIETTDPDDGSRVVVVINYDTETGMIVIPPVGTPVPPANTDAPTARPFNVDCTGSFSEDRSVVVVNCITSGRGPFEDLSVVCALNSDTFTDGCELLSFDLEICLTFFPLLFRWRVPSICDCHSWTRFCDYRNN